MIKRGTRIFQVPSAAHEVWHRQAMYELIQQGIVNIKNVQTLHITIYPKDLRKGDLTNKAESVNDILVDAGILKDDNWFEVPKIMLQLGEIDKYNPRAEITIL